MCWPFVCAHAPNGGPSNNNDVDYDVPASSRAPRVPDVHAHSTGLVMRCCAVACANAFSPEIEVRCERWCGTRERPALVRAPRLGLKVCIIVAVVVHAAAAARRFGVYYG